MEEPHRRDVDVLGGGGGEALVELRSGVVLCERKSGESVSLGVGHSFTGRESPAKEVVSAGVSFHSLTFQCTAVRDGERCTTHCLVGLRVQFFFQIDALLLF